MLRWVLLGKKGGRCDGKDLWKGVRGLWVEGGRQRGRQEGRGELVQ